MRSYFDENISKTYANDPLLMRVYTSRLLGKSKDLVLHGGGNTSVKIDDTIYVKGSGWDLSTIKKEGFAPVKTDALLDMAKVEKLSDSQMVMEQKAAMIDKNAPNPSIEAILHAVIPYKYVDHTHADAVVTITNTPDAKEYLRQIYGDSVLIIEYIMPGFPLAKAVYERTKNLDFDQIEGIVLLNHGVFTFDDSAKRSYEKMISLVSKAEDFLQKNAPIEFNDKKNPTVNIDNLANEVSRLRGERVFPKEIATSAAHEFSRLENIREILHKGPLTPEHVIRTKAFAMLWQSDFKEDLENFVKEYKEYFNTYAKDEIMLDPAPRWCVIKNRGVVVFGTNEKENSILSDIISHTMVAILRTQKFASWKSLSKKDIFEMEYWELEQAKLKK